MFIFVVIFFKIQHVQRSHNPRCYRQQLISLQEMITSVVVINLVYYNLLNLINVFTVWTVKMTTKPPPFERNKHYTSV